MALPTSPRELLGWYGYDVANSPYSQVVIAIFAPLLMEKLADTHANAGSAEPDCDAASGVPVYPCRKCVEGLGDRLFSGEDAHVDLPSRRVRLFGGGAAINPVAYASLFISFSVIFQAFAFVTFGALADYGRYRLALLRATGALGALATVAFGFIPGGADNHRYWEVPGVLLVVSNVFFGLSVVFYNAFLPLLVANHPDIDAASPEDRAAVSRRVENEVSAKGFIWGYHGGVFMLLFSGAVLLASGALASDAEPHVVANGYKYACLASGVWWLVGTALSTRMLETRPGPPLPFDEPADGAPVAARLAYCGRVLSLGWASTARTLGLAYRSLPTTFVYLVVYFVYSDSFSTISAVGILYARTQLCLTPTLLFVVATLVPVSALAGNFLWLRISVRHNVPNKLMVIAILGASGLIPLWGCLSFTAAGVGFVNQWEVYMLGIGFGLCLGGLQSYSRTLFANFIPAGMESEFFALFEITDKGSSWLGPLVVSLLNQSTDSLRFAFVYLVLGCYLPMFALLAIDEAKGKAEALAFAKASAKDADPEPRA